MVALNGCFATTPDISLRFTFILLFDFTSNMRSCLLLLFSIFIVFASSQSTSDALYSSSTESVITSKYANSSPTSSSSSSYGPIGSSESTETPGTDGTSGTTNKVLNSPTSDSLNLDDVEKLVTYTTKQKTIFIACCGGTFVLLIALAILSGMSDTIARSRQKNSRTHA
ncbi:Protein CBG02804 [Caenorhabditis briggsae]|uniref:Uncharacterized protein n=2 Tax=Caenorhabditis briggsae TaxID=6238 RepID=A0AAE9DKE9_CAEBR|nr:Protein CBG02804 [Caenorhabditis briggsae]ULU06301.1 hypothetical protein L3Y34_018277 [Caenorhabditis briggsae]CAP23782.2 Protein CBG02804 [Caenorhabditis briggsae]